MNPDTLSRFAAYLEGRGVRTVAALEHPNICTVHEIGETFADVTEGNPWPIGYVWERLRYDWSSPGSVQGRVVG